MRKNNRIFCAALAAGAFIAGQAATFTSADTIHIDVGTPKVTMISTNDYAWAYPITAFRTSSSGSDGTVNFQTGDGLVFYDFNGFTGQWSFAPGAGNFFSQGNAFSTFSASSTKAGDVEEFTTATSNNLDSGDYFGSSNTETFFQTDVNTVAAAATSPKYVDSSTISNLTFELANGTVNPPGGKDDVGEVGTATLTVFSVFGPTTEVNSVYGSATDGNGSKFPTDSSGDVNGGKTLVPGLPVVSTASSVPLPKASLTFVALMSLIGLNRLRKSHSAAGSTPSQGL